jgi:2-polyprenyl-3-methyl-5-hydroxy-6-metoxy-1,4-benzoquinol methylase
VALDELHLDRARAESFGSVAEQYDRYRPTYPDALIDDLAALQPAQVLDVGCGTGKAAVALARRGLSVLGVELDERMADVARGHGISVEVAAFETWDDAGRRFDLITCAGAWHWIDHGPGVSKPTGGNAP